MRIHHGVGEAGPDGEIGLREALAQDQARADLPARLLVVGHVQLDRAVQRGAHGLESLHGEGIGRDIAFGDRDAAPDHPPVHDVGRIGVMGPAFAGRHHVAMGVQRHHWSWTKALPHDEVGGAHHADPGELSGGDRVALDHKAEALQQTRGVPGMRVAVAGRVVGGEADELGQHRDLRGGLAVEIGRDGVRRGGGRVGGHAGPSCRLVKAYRAGDSGNQRAGASGSRACSRSSAMRSTCHSASARSRSGAWASRLSKDSRMAVLSSPFTAMMKGKPNVWR